MTSRLLFAVASLITVFCVSVFCEDGRKRRDEKPRYGNALLDEPDYLNIIPPLSVQMAYRSALCQKECQPAFQKIERLHICVMESQKFVDDCSARRCIQAIVPEGCDTLRKALITSASESACPDGLGYMKQSSSPKSQLYHRACVMLTLAVIFMSIN